MRWARGIRYRRMSWLVVLKTENHCVLKTMKKYCKDIDITDRDFISTAVHDCIKRKLKRSDTIRLLSYYSGLNYYEISKIVGNERTRHFVDGIIEAIVDGIRQEILHWNYVVKPINYTVKVDGNSGKIRDIGIQDIKQQLYDYIASKALYPLFEAKIGYYQCNALTGRGQVFGAMALKKWVDDHHIKYAIQSDIRHFYESIDRDVLKEMLRRDVKNERLLHLVFFLIDTFKVGLAIGSVLSQHLAAYYLSAAYHYVTENLYRVRKHKAGSTSRINLVDHVLWFADDCIMLGSNLKDLKKAHRLYAKYCDNILHVEVKPDVKIIDLRMQYIDVMGYKISRKNVTIRSSDFLRLRRNQRRIERYDDGYVPLHEARGFCSRSGALKHTDSRHYIQRSHAYEIKNLCNKIIALKSQGRYAA